MTDERAARDRNGERSLTTIKKKALTGSVNEAIIR